MYTPRFTLLYLLKFLFSYRLRHKLVLPNEDDIGQGLECLLASAVDSMGRLLDDCYDIDVSACMYTFGHIHIRLGNISINRKYCEPMMRNNQYRRFF